MSHEPDAPVKNLPGLFATIHYRGEDRPDGYTAEEIAERNRMLRTENPAAEPDGEGPA